MSSSESEDDYANIANKLQKIKNQYREANKTLAKLDDSFELDQYLENQDSGAKTLMDSPPIEVESIAGPSVSNKTSTSAAKPAESTNKRRTRSSAAKSKSQDSEDDNLPNLELENLIEQPLVTRRGRRRTNKVPNTDSSEETVTRRPGRCSRAATTPSPRNRGRAAATPSPRNRGRSRGGRRNRTSFNRARFFNVFNMGNLYPIHAIGDADEPYDQSHGQELFKKPSEPDVIAVDDNETDPLDDNEELSVKVYWQNCELVLFKIRKYQKITQIFDHFSEKKRVSKDNLLFMYNDKILKPDDTPDSINYSIADLIDGGIVNQNVSNLRDNDQENIKDGIKLKFQCAVVKKPFEMVVRPDDKFSIVMTKCAEHLEVPLSRLKFEFDGDVILSKNTARELELEGGECIDIKVVS